MRRMVVAGIRSGVRGAHRGRGRNRATADRNRCRTDPDGDAG